MKVSSKIEICNLALARIEQNSISSSEYGNDTTVQGQKCALVYEQSKSSLLARYNWTFAIKNKKLNKVGKTAKAKDKINDDDLQIYKYKYDLPEGFLRLVTVYDNSTELIQITGHRPPYVLKGGYLYSDCSNCIMEFVYDLDEVSLFSPLFIDCFILDMAIRLTKIFNSSSTYLQELQVEFMQALAKATQSDCAQTMLTSIRSYPLLYSSWGF